MKSPRLEIRGCVAGCRARVSTTLEAGRLLSSMNGAASRSKTLQRFGSIRGSSRPAQQPPKPAALPKQNNSEANRETILRLIRGIKEKQV